MARGGRGGKRQRSTGKKPVVEQPADEGSEYVPEDEEGEESDDEEPDWEDLPLEVLSKKKGKAPVTAEQGKGKDKGKGKSVGAERAQESEPPRHSIQDISFRRRSMYSSKHCIGERDVEVASIIEVVPAFRDLFELGNLHQICAFPEQSGYGLELIREFYMRAGNLSEPDGGPYLFTTSVRGVKLTITPETIGTVLEMPANTDGVEYLRAGFDSVADWERLVNAICVPNVEVNQVMILSKELKMEYRFLNFVVCYNILPLANTKILRWDRVLYMYLVGRPDIVQSRNININIPFLIWRRMAKDIKTSGQKERLPFPMIIMRILRLHEVNTRCTSYEHSLTRINRRTFVKSNVQLKAPSQPGTSSPVAPPPATSSAPSASRRSVDVAEEDVLVSSVYREQQRLSEELQRLSSEQALMRKDMGKMKRLIRAIFDKLGCSPQGDDSD